jgi:hypothetical protein
LNSRRELRVRSPQTFGSSGDLLPPSPPGEKTTAREDQAGKACTGDGAGDTTDGDRRIVVSLKAAITPIAQDQLGDRLS